MFSLMSRTSKRSTSSRMTGYDSVAVRMAREEDVNAIYRIAALDDKKAPQGRVLVAEADGELIAALGIDGGSAVADPFRWTSDVLALMEMRAEQIAAVDLVPTAATGGAVRTSLNAQHA
jgi:hypothetical protein